MKYRTLVEVPITSEEAILDRNQQIMELQNEISELIKQPLPTTRLEWQEKDMIPGDGMTMEELEYIYTQMIARTTSAIALPDRCESPSGNP